MRVYNKESIKKRLKKIEHFREMIKEHKPQKKQNKRRRAAIERLKNEIRGIKQKTTIKNYEDEIEKKKHVSIKIDKNFAKNLELFKIPKSNLKIKSNFGTDKTSGDLRFERTAKKAFEVLGMSDEDIKKLFYIKGHEELTIEEVEQLMLTMRDREMHVVFVSEEAPAKDKKKHRVKSRKIYKKSWAKKVVKRLRELSNKIEKLSDKGFEELSQNALGSKELKEELNNAKSDAVVKPKIK